MTATKTQTREPDLARLLTLVERQVVARLTAALKAEGATVEEWRVLSLLSDGAGHAMAEVAEFAMLPAPTLTKVIDRMVAANLVYRRADEVDRRRVLAFVSDRGRKAFRRWAAGVSRAQHDLEAAIGGEETALLRALLARISGSLPG